MPPIRVLVVDDSAVVRKVMCDGLAPDAALTVVGTAANGRIALAKIPLLHPDIVTLDVEMPEMDGIEALTEIRKLYPKLPVIMFSTVTERGAAITLDALALGASDYVTKPSNTGSLEATLRRLRAELIPKIKALCAARRSLPAAPSSAAATASSARAASKQTAREFGRVDVLAIGTSTGGPNALADLLPAIPANFPVPIVIVQHMPALFTRLLAGRLNQKSGLNVREGVGGEVLKPGDAWIAPGDFHMTVEKKGATVVLVLNQSAPESYCRPAVDPMFRSVANAFGASALAVVLTGMGSDGTSGAQLIHEKGGQVLVQDQASSIVWGMPGQVAAAGLADGTFALKSMAAEICRRVALKRSSPSGAARPSAAEAEKGAVPQRP
jgi:two-component system, chemotaxis family, protein-glutamate methylesterase/glutaminase